ncbi:hypothetical protein MYAM1_000643 [Malassezia yamatoensis]|uniref:Uncharacterized protein n=1 Tax=Malassezia yamatoensis TaxID=253288 RepID=A0AAJ5YP37_9BASI|nr:hypothetical protein MYAM1_000643 [Malassezia yamatoensis]
MFLTAVVRRRAEPPHDTQDKSTYRPVSRTERLNRLENVPEERLRRLAKNVDTWTESRSDKSIWQSWLAIAPKTRIMLGLGALAFSFGGLYLADYLEKQYPVHNNRTTLHNTSKPQLQDGDENSPRLFSISVVDHKQ